MFPLGRSRSGGSDPLWLNIETFAKRLPPKEIDKLCVEELNRLIDNILFIAKYYRDKLEWLYRPTIEPEEYYGTNAEYIKKEDELYDMKPVFNRYVSHVNRLL